jgi:hypothetical protein
MSRSVDVFSFWQRRRRWIIAITLLLVVRALLPPVRIDLGAAGVAAEEP